jgi:hypothetical protein
MPILLGCSRLRAKYVKGASVAPECVSLASSMHCSYSYNLVVADGIRSNAETYNEAILGYKSLSYSDAASDQHS